VAQNRNKHPITVTLSPEALEALEILQNELDLKNRSQVIDYLIKESLVKLGYEPKEK
jgi:metal-responsive CopG/Arc/MetJ family transcriptional regulator